MRSVAEPYRSALQSHLFHSVFWIEHLTALHHAMDALGAADVGQWVSLEHDHVGELAGGESAEVGAAPTTAAPPWVAAVSACMGVRPASTISSSSRCSAGPGSVPMLPASEPAATLIPYA